MKKYLQATDQDDPRMADVPNPPPVQPWKEWWPALASHEGSESSRPHHSDVKTEQPWRKWSFDNSRRFEKPWTEWPMKWPLNYNTTVDTPVPTHDQDLIWETLRRQGLDPKLNVEAPRTTSFLQFFAADTRFPLEKPYVSKIPPQIPGRPQINFGGRYQQVMLTDISGYEERFHLDVNGFEFRLGAYKGPNIIENMNTYMQFISSWLLDSLGCSEVFVFDYALRHEKSRALGLQGYVDVARRVHCDQTPRSAIGRIKLHMGERAEELLNGRCRLINVWRPLVPTVDAYPLAVCSFTTVTPSDLVPVDIIFPHYAEEAFEVLPSSRHRWYFRSGMTCNDIALLKVYDSSTDPGVAYCAPHSGFHDPRAQGKVPRSSVELRCLVFGDRTPASKL